MPQPVSPRICRVCLTSDMQLHIASPGSSLQTFYESLTHVKLNNGGPETLCCYCVAMLQKCCKFAETARQANAMLQQWHNGNTDWVPVKLLHLYTKTAVDIKTYIHVNNLHTDSSSAQDVKNEALSTCVDNVEDNVSTYLEEIETDKKVEQFNDFKMELDDTNCQIQANSQIKDTTSQMEDTSSQLEDTNSQLEDTSCQLEDTNSQLEDTNSQMEETHSHMEETHSQIEDTNNQIEETNSEFEDTNSQTGVLNSCTQTPNRGTEELINNKIVKTKQQKDFSLNKSNNKSITQRKLHSNSIINLLSNKKELKTDRKLGKTKKKEILTADKEKLNNKEKILSCDLCNYKSFSMRYINQHRTRVHTSETSASCPVCKEKIDNITNLNKHMKKRHKDLNIKLKILSCSLCEFTCLKKSLLNNHLLRHNDRINCDFCEYIGTKVDVKKHAKSHIGEKDFSCDLCGFKAHTKLGVVQHKIDIHGSSNKLFYCSMCDFKCIGKHQLKNHVWKHEDEKTCMECSTEFQDIYHLNEHLKQHNEEISCDNCEYKCSNKIQLLNHIKIHSKKFNCSNCNKQFLKMNHLKSHLKIHTGEKSHVCHLCDYKTYIANNLKRHLLTHTDHKPYCCPECETKHKSETNLKNHMKILHNKIYKCKTHSCKKCSFKCERKNQLQAHIKSKHTLKPFRKKPGQKCICNYCDFSAAKKSELERHIFIHTGHKPYSCPECKQAFKCKYYLKKHIKMKHVFDRKTCSRCNKLLQNETELQIHANVCLKKFLCDICGSKWKNSLLLKRHMMIHTGEKPFACELCLYRSSLESSMVKHMRVHTNEKPYACDKCSYRCAVSSNLVRHLVSHSNEKPFSCHICEAKYKIKRDLKRHINRLHGFSDVIGC